ncbi:MAG: transposase [Candidatus Carbobacillus altaicus]|nr:transposase [Candidatus Carbobacillus altaicus]
MLGIVYVSKNVSKLLQAKSQCFETLGEVPEADETRNRAFRQKSETDPVREAMRTKAQSDKGKAIYCRRKAIVEPAWGEMKGVQGFRQFHLRSEAKVEGKCVLLALSLLFA